MIPTIIFAEIFIVLWTIFLAQHQPLMIPLGVAMFLLVALALYWVIKVKVVITDSELICYGLINKKSINLRDISKIELNGPDVRGSQIGITLKDGSFINGMLVGQMYKRDILIKSILEKAPRITINDYLKNWLEKYADKGYNH